MQPARGVLYGRHDRCWGRKSMKASDSRELQRRVDEVLYYVWDPIGVSDEPCARAEYEGYILQVLRLVEENDDIQPISKHLANVVSTCMELCPDEKRCDHTAEILLIHKEAIEQGLA